MNSLKLQKIPFSKDADNKLRALKSRTGITPNILCRIGFCMSLERSNYPLHVEIQEKGREINRHTLLGDYESIAVSLLKVWMDMNSAPMEELDDLFVSHMNRGVVSVFQKVKSLSDMV